MSTSGPLLSVEGLDIELPTPRGPVRVVREVDFSLERGAALGIVGESGCGKTMTALAVMGLLPDGARVSGSVRLDGTDLLALDEAALCRLRGDRIAMVFQEPMTALNPVHTIGRQVAEPLRLHRGLGRRRAWDAAAELLDRVGIPEPRHRLAAYPHELSGGQRQRVMIAMALACGPDLLVADEPTTALDVTTQAQILDLVRGLAAEMGMALLLITHDLAVVAAMTDRVVVMYAGTVVERAPTSALLNGRAHPYTQGLFRAVPQPGEVDGPAGRRLATIPGMVPDPHDLPAGCPFAGRCYKVAEACHGARPPMIVVGPDHEVACIRTAVPA